MIIFEKSGLSSNNVAKEIKFNQDIYSGMEKMEFKNRHPIYKTLMKLEFEEVMREFMKKSLSK